MELRASAEFFIEDRPMPKLEIEKEIELGKYHWTHGVFLYDTVEVSYYLYLSLLLEDSKYF